MRVFPFTDASRLNEFPVRAPRADNFIMEYPCIIGYRLLTTRSDNGRTRIEWQYYQYSDGQLHHISRDRDRATPIKDPETLNQLLTCIAMLGGATNVFVEPANEPQKK